MRVSIRERELKALQKPNCLNTVEVFSKAERYRLSLCSLMIDAGSGRIEKIWNTVLSCYEMSVLQAATSAVVDGLFSALASLGVVPIIRCPKVSSLCSALCANSHKKHVGKKQ